MRVNPSFSWGDGLKPGRASGYCVFILVMRTSVQVFSSGIKFLLCFSGNARTMFIEHFFCEFGNVRFCFFRFMEMVKF